MSDSPSKSIRILYIEDSATATLLVRAGLGRSSDFEVDAVGTLADALVRLSTEEYDAVLLDLGLPDSEGMATLISVRGEAPDIAVIVLTGHSYREVGIAALHNGADEFLEKDNFDGKLLTRLIMFAIERRRLLKEVSLHRRHVETAEVERNRLVEAVSQVDDLVIITDVDGTIQYTNPAFERITGYATDEVLGQTPRILASGITPTETYESLWSSLKSEKTWRGHFVNRRKDGALYSQESVLSPIRSPQGQLMGFVGIGRDVTIEREVEARLRQSQKLQALGQLSAGVAHDFNNMLAVILTVAGVAKEDLQAEGSPVAAEIDEIIAAARRAEGVVARLLGFSRQAGLRLRPVDLGEVVTGMIGVIRATLPTTIDLDSSIETGLLHVLADPNAVEQVLLNLVTNARDAMLAGGELRITLESVKLDEEFTKAHPRAQSGDHVCIAVADTGDGFDPDIEERIFTPFFTTKSEGEGTGLGLALVSGLMEQHSGAVHAYSELGMGSVFKVYFPALRERRKHKRSDVPTSELTAGNGELLLLVEDDAALRRAGSRVLTRAGYEVIVAADGQEGLDLYRASEVEIAAVVSDLVMPHLGGRELLAAIRGDDDDVPFVLTSGYLERTSGDASEHVIYLGKPWSVEDLRRGVHSALALANDQSDA